MTTDDKARSETAPAPAFGVREAADPGGLRLAPEATLRVEAITCPPTTEQRCGACRDRFLPRAAATAASTAWRAQSWKSSESSKSSGGHRQYDWIVCTPLLGIIAERGLASRLIRRPIGVAHLQEQFVTRDQAEHHPAVEQSDAAEHSARRNRPERGEQFQQIGGEVVMVAHGIHHSIGSATAAENARHQSGAGASDPRCQPDCPQDHEDGSASLACPDLRP